MGIGFFVDRNCQPAVAEAVEKISASKPLWEKLTSFIENNYKLHGEFKFYGKNFGWALRFCKSGKSLIALYPGDSEFSVQVVLNNNQVQDALNADISERNKNIIKCTPEIREGRWIFIKVISESDISDVQKLLIIRAKKSS